MSKRRAKELYHWHPRHWWELFCCPENFGWILLRHSSKLRKCHLKTHGNSKNEWWCLAKRLVPCPYQGKTDFAGIKSHTWTVTPEQRSELIFQAVIPSKLSNKLLTKRIDKKNKMKNVGHLLGTDATLEGLEQRQLPNWWNQRFWT